MVFKIIALLTFVVGIASIQIFDKGSTEAPSGYDKKELYRQKEAPIQFDPNYPKISRGDDIKSYQEIRQDAVLQGHYQLIEEDGQTRIVEYKEHSDPGLNSKVKDALKNPQGNKFAAQFKSKKKSDFETESADYDEESEISKYPEKYKKLSQTSENFAKYFKESEASESDSQGKKTTDFGLNKGDKYEDELKQQQKIGSGFNRESDSYTYSAKGKQGSQFKEAQENLLKKFKTDNYFEKTKKSDYSGKILIVKLKPIKSFKKSELFKFVGEEGERYQSDLVGGLKHGEEFVLIKKTKLPTFNPNPIFKDFKNFNTFKNFSPNLAFQKSFKSPQYYHFGHVKAALPEHHYKLQASTGFSQDYNRQHHFKNHKILTPFKFVQPFRYTKSLLAQPVASHESFGFNTEKLLPAPHPVTLEQFGGQVVPLLPIGEGFKSLKQPHYTAAIAPFTLPFGGAIKPKQFVYYPGF